MTYTSRLIFVSQVCTLLACNAACKNTINEVAYDWQDFRTLITQSLSLLEASVEVGNFVLAYMHTKNTCF
eukprot:m.308704 g.308704  ORF g.308704 m.308704 type:complete len:70 (-) comp16473_c0_seq16:24-233(-)